MVRGFLLFLATAAVVTAQASPAELTYQGRLVDTQGAPLQGSETITIGLYTQPSGGSPEWSETDTVTLADGYFSTTLGDQQSLSSLTFSTTSYWVGITPTTGTELLPRPPCKPFLWPCRWWAEAARAP